ncbi:Protein NtpR [Lentibacillus sp. JNUCC-1]|nr:Protein NtpR [Lentibacillus sp. JNUCC-1]
MIKRMLDLDKPVLAVCRGIQILNIAMDGDMYQDIYTQIDRSLLQHSQNAPLGHGSHFVEVTADSLLHRLTGMDTLRVNSRHHQANRRVKAPLKTSGLASDMIIEAVESEAHRFVLGLQWHPENMLTSGDEASRQIYNGFIEACKSQS